MVEQGNDLELAIPERLAPLARLGEPWRASAGIARRYPSDVAEVGGAGGLAPLGPTDESRVRRTFRVEASKSEFRYMRPSWVDSKEDVPGLLISLRYTGQDAYGIAQRTRDLDVAFRRAAATLERFHAGERQSGWPSPMRPERGGLWILDTRRGSYEFLATVYGSLVIWASSTPVSLAALATLAWDSSVRANRLGRWTVKKFHKSPDAGPPELGSSPGDAAWGIKQTKALENVMLEAAKGGSGLEFVNNSTTGELRLTIYPRTHVTTEVE